MAEGALVYGHAVGHYDDPDADEVSRAGEQIADSALATARMIAAERLQILVGAAVADPAAAVATLLARDPDDVDYDLLRAFERRWSLLVIRLIEPVMSPAAAIRDARARGVTVSEIANVLGVRPQTIYARYGERILLDKETF